MYPFGSIFLERKLLCHDSLPFYSFLVCFQLELTCMLKIYVGVNLLLDFIFMYSLYGIEKNNVS